MKINKFIILENLTDAQFTEICREE